MNTAESPSMIIPEGNQLSENYFSEPFHFPFSSNQIFSNFPRPIVPVDYVYPPMAFSSLCDEGWRHELQRGQQLYPDIVRATVQEYFRSQTLYEPQTLTIVSVRSHIFFSTVSVRR